jgi:hypothetical protein
VLLRSTFSDFVDPAAIGSEMTNFWGDAMERFLEARKGCRAEAFIDVDYSDLLGDPIGVARRLYSQLGNDLHLRSNCACALFWRPILMPSMVSILTPWLLLEWIRKR